MLSVLVWSSLAIQRPNIVFIFSDDHASHAISAYGSQINTTPNIDKLAREGALFENCFVTNSICGPSRAVILTGKHSHLNGFMQNGDTFDGSQMTFPKLLQRAGYTTAIIGKWHLSSNPTGFDYWRILVDQGEYYNPRIQSPAGTERAQGYTTDLLTTMAKSWLKQQPMDKPFLLMLQHKAPHRNWQPAPQYLSLFEDSVIPEPEDLFDDWQGLSSGALKNEMSVAKHLELGYDLKANNTRYGMTDDQWATWDKAYKNRKIQAQDMPFGKDRTRLQYQWYIKDYLRCVQSVDDSVGSVMKELKDLGLDKNTIVIYSSDQGFFLGDHGWYDKRWMYEESMRTPLLIKWPGVTQPGSRIKALAQNLDFGETMLDMAGVPALREMQGTSLRPILKGKKPDNWRNSVYYHYYEFPGVHAVPRHRGIRTERYKIIHFYESDEWELYDLQTDPGEHRNLAEFSQYKRLFDTLKAQLDAEASRYLDNTLSKS